MSEKTMTETRKRTGMKTTRRLMMNFPITSSRGISPQVTGCPMLRFFLFHNGFYLEAKLLRQRATILKNTSSGRLKEVQNLALEQARSVRKSRIGLGYRRD